VRIRDRADVVVVNEVRGEKEDAGDERAGHHLTVTLPVTGPDPVITDQEKYGTDAVEGRVQCWKIIQ